MNYRVPAKNSKHDDGEPFYRYIDRMSKVKPLTPKDLDKVRKYAAYLEV